LTNNNNAWFGGAGKVGPLMQALSDLLWEDMKSGPDRIPVPYKH